MKMQKKNQPGIILVMLTLAASQAGCQVLATRNRGIEPSNTVTSSLGGIAATGDMQACADLSVHPDGYIPDERPPAELAKMSLPTYRIEPPDVLLINAVSVSPSDPYFLSPLDIVQVVVAGTLPEQPIAGTYQIEPSGNINLGPTYGNVRVEGLTTQEATDVLRVHLSNMLQAPEVTFSLLQPSGQQQIAGEHLVGPDGTVTLGMYGAVYVAGMTVEMARHTIEEHLAQFFDEPKVAVDVFSYNSKVFYIIVEGAGFGDQVVRIPVTGNETVLDALAQIGGLSRLSSKNIWISRPTPNSQDCDQILPVDWQAITRGANTCTNYQILPGDRIFVAEDRLTAIDSIINKLLNPIERILGFSLLAGQSIQTLNRFPAGRGGLGAPGFPPFF